MVILGGNNGNSGIIQNRGGIVNGRNVRAQYNNNVNNNNNNATAQRNLALQRQQYSQYMKERATAELERKKRIQEMQAKILAEKKAKEEEAKQKAEQAKQQAEEEKKQQETANKLNQITFTRNGTSVTINDPNHLLTTEQKKALLTGQSVTIYGVTYTPPEDYSKATKSNSIQTLDKTSFNNAVTSKGDSTGFNKIYVANSIESAINDNQLAKLREAYQKNPTKENARKLTDYLSNESTAYSVSNPFQSPFIRNVDTLTKASEYLKTDWDKNSDSLMESKDGTVLDVGKDAVAGVTDFIVNFMSSVKGTTDFTRSFINDAVSGEMTANEGHQRIGEFIGEGVDSLVESAKENPVRTASSIATGVLVGGGASSVLKGGKLVTTKTKTTKKGTTTTKTKTKTTSTDTKTTTTGTTKKGTATKGETSDAKSAEKTSTTTTEKATATNKQTKPTYSDTVGKTTSTPKTVSKPKSETTSTTSTTTTEKATATTSTKKTANKQTKTSAKGLPKATSRSSTKESLGGFQRKYTSSKYASKDVWDSGLIQELSGEERLFIDRLRTAKGGYLSTEEAMAELIARKKRIKQYEKSIKESERIKAENARKDEIRRTSNEQARRDVSNSRHKGNELPEVTGDGKKGGGTSFRHTVSGYNLENIKGISNKALALLVTEPAYVVRAVMEKIKIGHTMNVRTVMKIIKEEKAKPRQNVPLLEGSTNPITPIREPVVTGEGFRFKTKTAPSARTGYSKQAKMMMKHVTQEQRVIIEDMHSMGINITLNVIKKVVKEHPSSPKTPLLKAGDGKNVNVEHWDNRSPREKARQARKEEVAKKTEPNLTDEEMLEQAEWKAKQDLEDAKKADVMDRIRKKKNSETPKQKTKPMKNGSNKKKFINSKKVKEGKKRNSGEFEWEGERPEPIGVVDAVKKGNAVRAEPNTPKTTGTKGKSPESKRTGGNGAIKQKIAVRNDGTTETIYENTQATAPPKSPSTAKKQSVKQDKQKFVNESAQKKRIQRQKRESKEKSVEEPTSLVAKKPTRTLLNGQKRRQNINRQRRMKSGRGNRTVKTNTEKQGRPNRIDGGQILDAEFIKEQTTSTPKKTVKTTTKTATPKRKTAKVVKQKTKTTVKRTNRATRNTYPTIHLSNTGNKLTEVTVTAPVNDTVAVTSVGKTTTSSKSSTESGTVVNSSNETIVLSGTKTSAKPSTKTNTSTATKRAVTTVQTQKQATTAKSPNYPRNKHADTLPPKKSRPKWDEEEENKKKKRIQKLKRAIRTETVNQFSWLGIDLEPPMKATRIVFK